jgi:aromatic ring-opening dioxygenase catalytic subunit (LigB family)
MGCLVWAASVSHTGAMIRGRGSGEPDKEERVFAAFAQLSERLRAAELDALIVVGTDHFMTFSYDFLPIFCIGTGDHSEGWGEFGVPKVTVPVHNDLALTLHRKLVSAGFDISSVTEMRLDHSFICPLHYLTPKMDVPIVPLYVNCTVPPLPSLRRCFELGEVLRVAIAEQHDAHRVGIIGTGGISHWVGLPRTGDINEEFDRDFLRQYAAGKFDSILECWDDETIEQTAGNGAMEVRNWLIAAVVANSRTASVLAYEPVRAWKTGIALADLLPENGGESHEHE